MPESRRPVLGMDGLAVWCRRWLGAPPAAQLFEAGYLSTVLGLRLADGREVVVKVRPPISRLAGCTAVHRALWTAGFACPEPLVDLQPLDGLAATAEALVPDAGQPPPDSELAALSAAALARLVELAPDPWSVPSLAPSPSFAGWDHTEPGLWPTPEDLDVDLNAYPEPRWLDRAAAAVRDQLGGHADDPVIGHGDWPASGTAPPSSTPTSTPAATAGRPRSTRHAGPPDYGSACSTPRPDPCTAIPSRS